MSTDMPNMPTDAQLLYEYLGRKLDGGVETVPGQEVLADLAAYQQQLEKLRAMIREGEASLDAGEGRELDLNALLQRVRNRIAAEGKAS
jgi:hypothetical protein